MNINISTYVCILYELLVMASLAVTDFRIYILYKLNTYVNLLNSKPIFQKKKSTNRRNRYDHESRTEFLC